jgi:hypothetical protein
LGWGCEVNHDEMVAALAERLHKMGRIPQTDLAGAILADGSSFYPAGRDEIERLRSVAKRFLDTVNAPRPSWVLENREARLVEDRQHTAALALRAALEGEK